MDEAEIRRLNESERERREYLRDISQRIQQMTPGQMLRFAADLIECSKGHDQEGNRERAHDQLRIASAIVCRIGTDIKLALLQAARAEDERRINESEPSDG